MTSLFSKFLAFGVAVAACVGATALPASATPTDEAPPSAQQFMWKGGGNFKVEEGIDLAPGTIIENSNTKAFDIRNDANNVPQSIYFRFGYSLYFSAKAAFPIRQLGQATHYWLQTGVYNAHPVHRVRATCEVFDGEPGTPGAKPVWTSPFECVTTRLGVLDNDFDFTVRFAAAAESSGTIHTAGPVSLISGEYPDNGLSFFMKGAGSVPANGQTRFKTVKVASDPTSTDTRAQFSYAIADHGALTHYTMFGWNNSRGDQSRTVVPSGKYACTVEGRFPSSGHWDSTFVVGLDGLLAEASGTITPTDVALTDGVFSTDSGYHRAGAAQVAAGESTQFDTILLNGDTPFYENQARMEWAYQIFDNEVPTGVWVAGLSTNHRGVVKFSGDGRCAIYTSNPLRDGGRLDDAHPTEDTAYACSATGEMLHGPGETDNRHFDGTYTVTKK